MSIMQFLEQEAKEQQTGQIWDYISASRLSLWSKCPLAFRKRYIDQEPSSPSPNMFVGKVVHAVLAHIYRHRVAGEVCTAEQLPQFVADAWNKSLQIEPCYFDDTAQEEKCRYQILDLATAYLGATPLQEERPIAIEKRYEMPLIDPATGEDFGIPLVGIVDLLLENEQGRIIVDFKTASCS